MLLQSVRVRSPSVRLNEPIKLLMLALPLPFQIKSPLFVFLLFFVFPGTSLFLKSVLKLAWPYSRKSNENVNEMKMLPPHQGVTPPHSSFILCWHRRRPVVPCGTQRFRCVHERGFWWIDMGRNLHIRRPFGQETDSEAIRLILTSANFFSFT